MMLENIETCWNSNSTPRFEPRRMPPKSHKEATKQNHGIYCTSLDSTVYLLASAIFPVQICRKFEYVLGSISNRSHRLQRLATPNNDFWSFASRSQIRTQEMGWKWICQQSPNLKTLLGLLRPPEWWSPDPPMAQLSCWSLMSWMSCWCLHQTKHPDF